MREKQLEILRNVYHRESNRPYETYGKTVKLRHAWYFDDFREFIPSAYCEEYLDFSKYPLKYKL